MSEKQQYKGLRFVMRDGKRILQQPVFDTDGIVFWVDVPLVDEATGLPWQEAPNAR